jgi:hypothetical protein
MHLPGTGTICKPSSFTKQGSLTHYVIYRDGEQYASKQYYYNEEKNEVWGCPACAPAIRSLIKVVKAKCSANGISRRSADPMTVEDLTCIICWSERRCPTNQLVAADAEDFNFTKHVMMRAYMTTGFTLWTRWVQALYRMVSAMKGAINRNFELCKLQAGHISGDQYKLPYNSPHFVVSLLNHKGWLRGSNGQWINDPDGVLKSV